MNAAKQKFPTVHTFQSDVSNPEDIQKLYTQVIKQFPALNILINNAGVMRQIDLQNTSLDLENIYQEIATNLTGTIQMVHQFLPHLSKQKSSAIVNVSSAISFLAYSIAPIYSASKAGVHAYTKALRLQLQNTNIRVFEVIPPGMKTNLQNGWLVPPDPSRMMEADKMVSDAIKGLLKDKPEILPGLAGMVKTMSRIAPGFTDKNMGHNEFKRLKQLEHNNKKQAHENPIICSYPAPRSRATATSRKLLYDVQCPIRLDY